MKKAGTAVLVLTLTIFITAITAIGQPVWTVDENGPALLGGGPIVGFANGGYKLDPVSGLMGWYYPLGPSVPGDLVLSEPPNTNIFSDILRFDGNGVFFFSDAEAGQTNLDKADVFQLPPVGNNPQGPTIFRVETGIEGNNGFFWAPGPGQPGFDLSGQLNGLAYNIISDAVPEPRITSLLLASVGLFAWRRAMARRSGHYVHQTKL